MESKEERKNAARRERQKEKNKTQREIKKEENKKVRLSVTEKRGST